ncbi:MAG: diguanylate cyclase [Proteobacteria bacterium]|nr:diguanylate cyclase [Pseudomonadota bacterium]
MAGAASEAAPGRRPRVLLADDDALLRRTLARALSHAFEVTEVEDGERGLALARELRPEVVIADQRMPKLNGVDLLAQLHDELPETTRVLITGFSDYAPVVEAINDARIHHYFEKPFHTVDLVTVVEALTRSRALERERDALLVQLEQSVAGLAQANARLAESEALLEQAVRERTAELRVANAQLELANAQLRELATHHGLTHLFNHTYLMEHLRLEVARGVRYQRAFSVLFVDLDDFKRVNDCHGHAVGDEVLATVARVLDAGAHALRRSDLAARYGGEEFCIVLPETPLAGALIKAERIRAAVEALRWPQPELSVTLSVGVASYPEDGTDERALLAAADRALYAAKQGGKNRVCAAR